MIYSIQHMRALATLIIVMTHVEGTFITLEPVLFLPSFKEANIAFTFAAGFLFRHLAFEEAFGSFIVRRARNVLLPYLVMSIPALCIYLFGLKEHPHLELSGLSGVRLALFLLLTGQHLGPLWFIPMIFLVYTVTPLLRQLERHALGYAVAIPLTLILAATVFPRPQFDDAPLIAALHFLPIFLIGMVCSRYYPQLRQLAYRFWIPSLIATLALIYLSAVLEEGHQFGLKTATLASGFLVLIRAEHLKHPVIDLLANYSFGIYFLHGYVIGALRLAKHKAYFQVEGNEWTLLLGTALVCALCAGTIWAIRQVLGSRSRYIIGA